MEGLSKVFKFFGSSLPRPGPVNPYFHGMTVLELSRKILLSPVVLREEEGSPLYAFVVISEALFVVVDRVHCLALVSIFSSASPAHHVGIIDEELKVKVDHRRVRR